MTTLTAVEAECPQTWLARRLAEGRPAETWKPMAPMGRCAFSYYEISDTGQRRSLDRPQPNGRVKPGALLAVQTRKDGYVQGDFYCDDKAACPKGGRHTLTMHTVVLAAFDQPPPPVMQGSHLYGNPGHNWFPEGLAWEDQPANERRKTWRPPPPRPAFPCRNAGDGCTGKALNPGRRCPACATAMCADAARMLDEGRKLPAVAAYFEVTEHWAWQQARKGGYAGSIEQARTQVPPLTGWRLRVARWVNAA